MMINKPNKKIYTPRPKTAPVRARIGCGRLSIPPLGKPLKAYSPGGLHLALFFTVIILVLVCSTLNAQSLTKDKAQERTLAQSKALLEAEGKIQAKQERDQQDYREKLGALITEEEPKEEAEIHQSLDSYFRFMPSRKVKAMSGKVEIIDSSSEYSYEFKAFGKLPVELSLDTQYIGIENTTGVELPAHLTGLTWGLDVTLPFFNFEKTYLRLDVRPALYSDDWNFDSSAFRIPSRYFLIYQPNDQWTFIGGVAVSPDFETEVWPILGFIYKPNDKLIFNLIPERPNITYLLNDRIALFAQGNWTSDEFEVTRDNAKNVVLQYKEKYLGGGIKFKFNKYIESSLSTGAVFGRILNYRDSQGKVNIKSGLYTEFRVDIQL